MKRQRRRGRELSNKKPFSKWWHISLAIKLLYLRSLVWILVRTRTDDSVIKKWEEIECSLYQQACHRLQMPLSTKDAKVCRLWVYHFCAFYNFFIFELQFEFFEFMNCDENFYWKYSWLPDEFLPHNLKLIVAIPRQTHFGAFVLVTANQESGEA